MADGMFYLGKELTGKGEELGKDYLLDADDLTTHAMVLGMTGSGKTGLCLDLVEEAIEAEIPLIIIDPKGDITNLALMFPEFTAADFQPWVAPEEAEKKGITLEQYAAETAAKWKKGLESWGITKEKVQKIKDNADIRIFTPGSSTGLPISILEGFQKPDMAFEDDIEIMVERIQNAVSALLALLDVDNDPLKSKPHILISNIIEHYWRLGRSLSIEDLIVNLQNPPFKKLGAFDIDQLIEPKERAELAFKINNIIASPTFRFWTAGMPLAAETLYKRSNGRTPVNIFYIAHLTESERMFFLTLLLNEVVYWIRMQSGSSKLKYLFYMDEIFGYLPAYPQNPSSKKPLLLLLKQARAFGLGLILATQNPKDIDYKGLTNMGTWFIGKLQAEGDRERVMEGLSGLSTEAGQTISLNDVKQMMAALATRRFLVKNVHTAGLKTFQSRWAISYLAGPLSRPQLKLIAHKPEGTASSFMKPTPSQTEAAYTPGAVTATTGQTGPHLLGYMPQTELALESFFDHSNPAGSYYAPELYMDGELIFDDTKLGIYVRKPFYLRTPIVEAPNWRNAQIKEEPIAMVPVAKPNAKGYEPINTKLNFTLMKRIQTSFKEFLFANLAMDFFINKDLNLASKGDETKEAFLQRCRDVVESSINKEVDKLKDTYAHKIERIEDRIQQEKLTVQNLEREHSSKRNEELLSIGESVLGLLMGSKARTGLSSAARKRRATSSVAGRVEVKKTKMSQLQEELQALQQELEDKVADIEDASFKKADNIEPLAIRLEKEDIIISRQAILWKLT